MCKKKLYSLLKLLPARICYLMYSCLLLILFHTTVFSQDSQNSWQGWRGIEKEGVLESSTSPTHWSSHKNIAWKTAIPGKGHSSPIIAGKSIIVTTAYYQEKNIILKKVIKFLIIGLSLFVFLSFLYFLIRLVYKNKKITTLNLINIWGFSFILGFVLYYSLTGIIFHINDNADHITQTSRWFLSGTIVSLCIMLITYTINNKLWIQICLIIYSILFSAFILLLRPIPEYYSLTGDGSFVEISIKSGILPLIIAIIIIISLFFYKRKPLQYNKSISSKHKSYFTLSILILGSSSAFIIGLYGIGIYRILRYSNPSEHFNIPLLDIYFRDSNIFMGIVFTSLAIWIFFYISNIFRPQEKKLYWISFGIIGLTLLVFINKNYLTGFREYVRAVVCIDQNSGKIKWIKEALQGNQSIIHPENSPASPTPIIYNNLIYAYFGSPGLLCLDMEGNIVWENKNLPFEDIHGVAASPMESNDAIIILNDMPKAPYITAIDYKTGKQKWKTNRKPWTNNHAAYRTPTIKKVNGKDVIITWGMYGINAYDAISGKELCNYPLSHSIGQLVASIISHGDTLFAPDRDKFYALSLSKLIEGTEPMIWAAKLNHKGPICSSPVYSKNMLFMIANDGHATCLDAINGNILWSKKLNGIYMTSCTLINGNIYFSSTSGLTTIIAAENVFRKISENKLPEPIYASVAPTSNQIFVRTTEHLWCVAKKIK